MLSSTRYCAASQTKCRRLSSYVVSLAGARVSRSPPQILSCLPSIGVPTYLLAEILHKPLLEVETSLVVSDSAGCTTMIESARGLTAKFTHDRYRVRLVTFHCCNCCPRLTRS